MADYQVQLDVFEGPMDLLIYLIRKNEIDIYDIPIALIADQYVSYLDRMEMLGTLDAFEKVVPLKDWSTSRDGGPRKLFHEELEQ